MLKLCVGDMTCAKTWLKCCAVIGSPIGACRVELGKATTARLVELRFALRLTTSVGPDSFF